MNLLFCKVLLLSFAMSITSFDIYNIECLGEQNRTIIYILDRVCYDCFDLYREPEVFRLCSSECYSSSYFSDCLDVLSKKDEEAKFQNLISRINVFRF